MTLSGREKTVFGFCILVAVGALLYVFALEPILTSWERMNRKIRSREIQLRKISRAVKEKKSLEAELKELTRGAKLGIPKEEWRTALLSSLDKMARESRVTIVGRQTLPIKEYGFYQELSAEVEVECDLATLSKFLYQMETSAQILNVETLQLNSKGRGSSRMKGQMSISAIQLVEGGEKG